MSHELTHTEAVNTLWYANRITNKDTEDFRVGWGNKHKPKSSSSYKDKINQTENGKGFSLL